MSQAKQSTGNRPVLLIIMDGWGIGSGGPEDAIAHANTPVFDRLWSSYAHTTLMTHGRYVGLPAIKDLGGSEVGHLTMGAGKILDQGPTRINKRLPMVHSLNQMRCSRSHHVARRAALFICLGCFPMAIFILISIISLH